VVWQQRFAGLIAASSVRAWMSSLDYQAVFNDPSVNPGAVSFEGPIIAVFWHEALLVPFYLQGHSHTAILASQHRDGDWVSSTATYMGYRTVRGSTFRGGSEALLRMVRRLRGYNLGIACDGPRGPRRQMAQGPIYLSSRLGIPIVPYGIGFQRAWRLSTWDRFAIPLPYSRVKLVFGRRIQIPSDLDRSQIESYRAQVEREMRQLTAEAEAWAATGARRDKQCALRRRPMPAYVRRVLASASGEFYG
jgi:lysophospholipid acyltransferase (LPLAT)-like uncharacterized protein